MSDDQKPKSDPNALVIGTSKGRTLVTIHADGSIEYGPEYTPDEAAVTFWTQMAQRKLESEERLIHFAAMEQMLMDVARADQAYEAAQHKAQALGASDQDQFTEERCRAALEAVTHRLIEFARGMIPTNTN